MRGNALYVIRVPMAVKEELNIANCFLLQFQSGVCDYNILIQSQFSHSHWEERHLLSDRITQPHILTLFLNLNQYFNLNIIAYNSYGNVSFSSTSISKLPLHLSRQIGLNSAFLYRYAQRNSHKSQQ